MFLSGTSNLSTCPPAYLFSDVSYALNAAIVKVSGIMDKEVFMTEMETSLSHKFAKKPEVLEGNMNALKMAWQEVR